jgi:hypothetical protein
LNNTQVLTNEKSKQEVMRIVMHFVSMSQKPFTTKKRTSAFARFCKWLWCGSQRKHQKNCPGHIKRQYLSNGEDISTCVLSRDQCSIFILDKSTVLTLRTPKPDQKDVMNDIRAKITEQIQKSEKNESALLVSNYLGAFLTHSVNSARFAF